MAEFDGICGISTVVKTIRNLFYQATDLPLDGKPKIPIKGKDNVNKNPGIF